MRVVVRDAEGIIYGEARGDIKGGECYCGGGEGSIVKVGKACANYIDGIATGCTERAGKG